MADTVQRVKEKLSIVDVVAPYVKLTKAGKYWKGLSPFNKEKTPSFYVSPDRGTYYCFSSNQGGDMFTFIEKMEGVDFKGSLKILAEKAGVPLEFSKGKDRGKADRLREALSEAESFFARNLTEESEAYRYALSRGLTAETIRTWNLGFAPDGWRSLLEELSGKGFTLAELNAAGLIKEADEKKGTWYDRFRNRLMFPIRDSAGRTVAFTGRALAKDEQAKYLNSPETELYKKSEVLFGLSRAKDAIRTRSFAILVEGQFDLVLLHQIGFQNTIALSGTALTPTHVSLIKRYADNLMLALDADRAGLAASLKSAITALGSSMRVKAIRMPVGQDPADIASKDPAAFTKLVKESEPIVEFFLSVLAENEKDPHKLILAAEKTVIPLIGAIRSPLEREHFIGITSRSLTVTPEAVRASVKQGPAVPAVKVEGAPEGKKQVSEVASRGDFLRAIVGAYPDTALAERVKSEYARITGMPFPEEDPPEGMLFEAGLALGETPSETGADEDIRRFESAVLTEAYAAATARLRAAEVAKDAAAIATATKACNDLRGRIAAFSK